MNKTKFKKSLRLFIFILLSSAFVWNCTEDKVKDDVFGSYDPTKPITLDEFYPDSGGIATKVIIKGTNFGTDPEAVRVWFNKKRASVVKAIGNMLYVITPKQPGDTNIISVAIGDRKEDSVSFKNFFRYSTTTTVTTIAGKAGGGRSVVDGTLAEAQFDHPRYICIDAEKNIFVSEFHAHRLRQLNEERNIVATIHNGNGLWNPNAPSTDVEGKVVFVPTDGGNTMFEFDPEQQWAGKKITPRQDPESENFRLDYKHSLASNTEDGMMYTRAYNGQLIKFNPRTKAAFLVAQNLMNDSDSYLCFHPDNMDKLYIAYAKKHCVYIFDVKTKEHTLLAGMVNQRGWADGEATEAQFYEPRQICFGDDKCLYIADSGNHCIRKISPDGIVSTVVGLPGVRGYRDGTPEDALFNWPSGVAVDDEGIIYVADYENLCVRKLAIE
jgi:IPT/TIG domain./NHL repeat.